MRVLGWVLLALVLLPLAAFADPEGAAATAAAVDPNVQMWAFAAAAVAAGLSSVGAAYAVAAVGSAAVGAVAEKPEMAGRAIVFVGLAEGIAIYGLIIAIMILGRVE